MSIKIRNTTKESRFSNDKVYMVVTVLVSLYITWAVYFSLFNTYKFLWVALLIWVVSFLLLNQLFFLMERWSYLVEEPRTISSIQAFRSCFLIILVGQIIYWLAYYPGGFNLDALGQWDQAHGLAQLNNWHPILTTAFYWLVTRIADSLALCIFTQILFFSFSLARLLTDLYNAGISIRIITLIAVAAAVNPAIGLNNACLFKDVPFTIAIIWAYIFLIKLYLSNGEWLKNPRNVCLMTIDCLVMILIRHNGIFFAFPVFIVLMIAYKKQIKSVLVSFILLCSCIVLVEGPIFKYLNVTQHNNVIGEAVGVPMGIMANALVNDSENIPEEVRSFLYDIADNSSWVDNYIVGEWDSCKWEFGGGDLFVDESLGRFLDLTIKTIQACPDTSYKAIKENTRVVWQIWGYGKWMPYVYVEENEYGIVENYNNFCNGLVNVIIKICNTDLVATFIWNVGSMVLIILVLLLNSIKFREYRKMVLIIPMMVYNLLTMCLLCGPNFRYFYFNSVIFLPIAVLMLKRDKCLV